MRRRSRAGGKLPKTQRRETVRRKRSDAPKMRGRGAHAPDQDTEIARVIGERDRALEQLSEALEQQTATSEVLKVISSSPGELEPVFQAMLENATRICQAQFGLLNLYDGSAFRNVALVNPPPPFAGRLGEIIHPHPESGLARVARTRQITHIDDLRVSQPYLDGDKAVVDVADLGGARTVLLVPMLNEGKLIGVISIYRQEVRPFTDKQIDLVKNFAAQAVIAIENTRLLNELRESLQQQTATAEVLRVISSSPGNLEPVFNAMLANATRICEAKFGVLLRFDGEMFRFAAEVGTPPAFAEFVRQRGPFRPLVGSHLARVMQTKQVSQTADYAAEGIPSPPVKLGGARSTVDVPMLKDDQLIGVFSIYRQEVRPFTDKQIELLRNFAAQAVIAIENARLLSELRESLEQQTATSEVLKIIAGSPGELEPIFSEMLENATRICEAKFGTLFLYDGNTFRVAAGVGTPSELAEFERLRGPFRPELGSRLERIVGTKQVIHIVDDAAEDVPSPPTRLAGARSIVAVPMLKNDVLIGAISIYRQEVRAFTEKQIALLVNFAAQAVIAIENARLLNELRESLEQQTATAEVLRVISSTQGELKPVFEALLANAVRLCEAKFGLLLLYEGNWRFRVVAMSNAPPAFAELRQREPIFEVTPETALGRAVTTKEIVHIADYAEEAIYKDQRHPAAIALSDLGGARTFLVVPMLNDQAIVGVIAIYRQQVRPFADKQVELVKNFASQAVIAIENARLLNELRQSLEQQTATADVLRVISSSPGEMEPVFEAILDNATRICEANFGLCALYENGAFCRPAMYNAPPAFAQAMAEREPLFRPSSLSGLMEAATTKQVVHISDFSEHAAYKQGDVGAVRMVELAGARTNLIVPMLKEGEFVGTISIYRQDVRPFTEKQIALMQNFAAQAVIAIENARLLTELRERTEQLEVRSQEVVKLNQQLEQRVADQVGEIERMSRLRRFLPPQVADLIVAAGTEKQLESHRREITALFCDLRGFTGFSESSDPEDVMALLRDYHAAIGEIIIEYSGTLERYAGDGVMVVFNDPVPVENPALQAVLMALEMRDAIGALTETWRRWGHDIGFGIGIAHGFATLGTIGFEGRFDYAAIGTVSNVASRLCDEARPGQILISPRVLTKVENAVTVEPVGEFTLKGIRRPMAAYNVLASSASNPN
jgi:GAF domain-containing protein